MHALTEEPESAPPRGLDRLGGSNAPPRGRLDSLTGLRFVAAFSVFGLHALNYGDSTWGDELFLAGTTGVSFFFIVSGYVMSWTARDGDRARLFFRRRFARVYPAYAVTWVLSLVVMVAAGRRPSLVDAVPLSLLQSWVPSESVYWATNAVFWTLSCEAFFYLTFPWLHRVVGTWGVRRTWAAAVAVVAVIEAISLGAWLSGNGAVVHWVAVVFPVTRAAEFALGVLLGHAATRGARWSPPLAAAVALAGAAFLLAGHVPAAFRDVAVTVVPFAVLIWAAAQADLAGRRSPFRSRPVVLLGTWSYAFYLVHSLVMMTSFEALRRVGVGADTLSGAPLLVALSAALVLAVTAAWLLHRVVEVPMERLLRPRRAVAPPA